MEREGGRKNFSRSGADFDGGREGRSRGARGRRALQKHVYEAIEVAAASHTHSLDDRAGCKRLRSRCTCIRTSWVPAAAHAAVVEWRSVGSQGAVLGGKCAIVHTPPPPPRWWYARLVHHEPRSLEPFEHPTLSVRHRGPARIQHHSTRVDYLWPSRPSHWCGQLWWAVRPRRSVPGCARLQPALRLRARTRPFSTNTSG